MSTYWYFECVSHDPPLRSDAEFTQHTADLAFRTALDLANSRPIPTDWWDSRSMSEDYFTSNACRFLAAHPRCNLSTVNEYGGHGPLPAAVAGLTPTQPDREQIALAYWITQGYDRRDFHTADGNSDRRMAYSFADEFLRAALFNGGTKP